MRLGKVISFLGSWCSLAVMTVISVGIGAVFSRVRGQKGERRGLLTEGW